MEGKIGKEELYCIATMNLSETFGELSENFRKTKVRIEAQFCENQ